MYFALKNICSILGLLSLFKNLHPKKEAFLAHILSTKSLYEGLAIKTTPTRRKKKVS
jgi:hypothetical protein